MNSEKYRETIKEQFLTLLNNPALKEHWLKKGSVTTEMYNIFLDKFGYRPYGGIFYDEIWSDNILLAESPDKDEKYPDGHCFRIRNHLGRDTIFLASIYNNWKTEVEVEQGYITAIERRKNKGDDLVFVDCELRIAENKLTNNSYMKHCDLRLLENEINKYIDLSERWRELSKV